LSGLTIGKKTARRISKVVRRVERTSLDGTTGDARGRNLPGLVPFPATVTTAIPTGTLGTPSNTGRVTIYRDNASGGLTAAETGQTCKNYHTLSASIAIGKTVTVYWRAGVFWLLAADC
jgi:hypothetical protein